MKKSIAILILLALYLSSLNAQRRGLISSQRYDTGGYFIFSAGPAYCSADTYGPLIEKSLLNGNNWSTSLAYRNVLPGNFGYRVNIIYGNYVGDDNLVIKPHNPFYSYSSEIIELTFRVEYTIRFGEKFRVRTPNSIYGFVGIGGISTNVTNPPIASFSILKTDTPHTISAILPMGIGYQYDFTNRLTLGAEAAIQYLSLIHI